MSVFYTFLSSLYNCLLKFILFTILLGEVRKFLWEVLKISGEVQNHRRGDVHLPAPPRYAVVTHKTSDLLLLKWKC